MRNERAAIWQRITESKNLDDETIGKLTEALVDYQRQHAASRQPKAAAPRKKPVMA